MESSSGANIISVEQDVPDPGVSPQCAAKHEFPTHQLQPQVIAGSYWAIGPPNSQIGDWVVPVLLSEPDQCLPMQELAATICSLLMLIV